MDSMLTGYVVKTSHVNGTVTEATQVNEWHALRQYHATITDMVNDLRKHGEYTIKSVSLIVDGQQIMQATRRA